MSIKINKLLEIDNYKYNNDYSLISKFYLEIYQNKKEFEKLYEFIDEETFVYLNIENYKNLMIN